MSPDSNVPVPPGSPRRSRRTDAERNRTALLDAARRLFDERGSEVPLDEVAKAAKVANATLYRNFATRADLVVAVYSGEVADLERLSARLLDDPDPDRALTDWLAEFVRHVATKRSLALAIPDEPDRERDTLFAGWRATMRTAVARLLVRAQGAGVVRRDLDATDLLALTSGIALSGLSADRLDALLGLARDGYRQRVGSGRGPEESVSSTRAPRAGER